MHSTPRLDDNGTVFSCNRSFANEYTSQLLVLPSPKVLEPPHSLNATIGSKAVFTCDFKASTDSKISQIHWEFNGTDLGGCKDMINCTVTQSSTATNYISSILEIYPVQADNAGQYTCYCSYDTSTLNVDEAQIIQSDHKSATLSVHVSPGPHQSTDLTTEASIGILIMIIVFITVVVVYRFYVYRRYRMYAQIPEMNEPLPDETLEKYIVQELFPFWEKLGKALNIQNDFLEDLPEDPAERLRAVLWEWNANGDHPSVLALNKKLRQLGLQNLIPQDVKEL